MIYQTRQHKYKHTLDAALHMLWTVFPQAEIVEEGSLPFVRCKNWYGEDIEPTFDFVIPEYRIAVDLPLHESEYGDLRGKERAVTLAQVRKAKQELTYANNYRWIELDTERINESRNQLIQLANEIYVMKPENGRPSLLTPRLPGDAGFDVVCTEPAVCEPQGYVDIPSDLFMEIPNHLYGVIQARSSTSKKRLLVLPGVIDASFRGRVYTMVYNLSEETVYINKGDRIAQMIFLPRAPHLHLQQVTGMRPTERGVNGFGSTGS